MFGIKIAVILLFFRDALSEIERDPELTPGYFQGDIENHLMTSRNVIGKEIYRWPNGTVYYVIEPNAFDESQMSHIFEAMSSIMSNSCITFEAATKKELPFAVKITGQPDGCNAQFLGFRNSSNRINLQPFPVGKGCFRLGSIMHEFLHALGFEHQHVAQDRDKYVSIQWENIDPEFRVNFINEDSTTHWHNFGEPYDYDSLMHYVPTAFSINGKPTIVALKEGNHRMGQRSEMSIGDIRKLNKMYKCNGYF